MLKNGILSKLIWYYVKQTSVFGLELWNSWITTASTTGLIWEISSGAKLLDWVENMIWNLVTTTKY